MNRKRAKELVGKQHLIEAIAEGKTIQHCLPAGKWIDVDYPTLNAGAEYYRVKPDPREFWTVIYNEGKAMSASKDNIRDAEDHIKYIRRENPDWCPDAYVAKVKEILDD